MGQQLGKSILIKESNNNYYYEKKLNKSLSRCSLKHQNILKVFRTPFENCQEILINNEIFFIQHTKISIKDFISNKIKNKKIVDEDLVLLLIQNLTYALAYLQDNHYPYPYLHPQNIFQCNQCFKLLPPQIIKNETYAKLKQNIKQKNRQYVPASPQMIIAARCKEPAIREEEILFKSNVFALGLMMMEVCTLKSSAECYDLGNYDILDEVITGRIEEIQACYSKKVVRIIANMLDYDFQQRMTPNKLSIWVNRTIKEPQDEGSQQIRKSQVQDKIHEKLYIANSRLVEQNQHIQKQSKQLKQNKQVIQQKQVRDDNRYCSHIKKSNRIDQIRAKITREKFSAQVIAIENRQGMKGGRKKSQVCQGVNRKKSKKDLFNPYFVEQHIQKYPEKGEKNQKGRMEYDRASKYQNNRQKKHTRTLTHQQSNHYLQQLPGNKIQPNLKYKYNYDDNQQNICMSQHRKNDSLKREINREIRIQNQLENYKRSLSGRKYDYTDKNKCYINCDVDKGSDAGGDDGQGSTTRKRKEQSKQYNYKAADFSFQPINYDKQDRQPKLNTSNSLIQKQSKLPWQQKTPTNNDKNTNDKFGTQKGQNSFDGYQVFQFNESKGEKSSSKQNEEIMQVKREIERSRKIIQEVKKIEESDQ